MQAEERRRFEALEDRVRALEHARDRRDGGSAAIGAVTTRILALTMVVLQVVVVVLAATGHHS